MAASRGTGRTSVLAGMLAAVMMALVAATAGAFADTTARNQTAQSQSSQTTQTAGAKAEAQAKVQSAASGGGAAQRQTADAQSSQAAADNTARLKQHAEQKRQASAQGQAAGQQKQRQAAIAQQATWTSAGEQTRHFNRHKTDTGATSETEYVAGARQTIAEGREFRYSHQGQQRVGYYDSSRNAFAGTSQQGGQARIHTYFHPFGGTQGGDAYVRGLEGSTYGR